MKELIALLLLLLVCRYLTQLKTLNGGFVKPSVKILAVVVMSDFLGHHGMITTTDHNTLHVRGSGD